MRRRDDRSTAAANAVKSATADPDVSPLRLRRRDDRSTAAANADPDVSPLRLRRRQSPEQPSAAKGDDDAQHEQPAVLLSGAAVPLFGPFRQAPRLGALVPRPGALAVADGIAHGGAWVAGAWVAGGSTTACFRRYRREPAEARKNIGPEPRSPTSAIMNSERSKTSPAPGAHCILGGDDDLTRGLSQTPSSSSVVWESARDSGKTVAPGLVFGLQGPQLGHGVSPSLRPDGLAGDCWEGFTLTPVGRDGSDIHNHPRFYLDTSPGNGVSSRHSSQGRERGCLTFTRQ